MTKFEGIFPALCTPYDSSGHLGQSVLKDLVDFHLSAGVAGFWLGGASAEFGELSEEERRTVVEIVVDHVAGRVPLIVHVGTKNDNPTAFRLARHAEETGADAVAAIPPCGHDIEEEAVIERYSGIAEACTLPLLVYNHPKSTGVCIGCNMVEKLQAIPTLAGIKFSDTDLIEMRKIVTLDAGCLTVLFGMDPMALAGLVMGASGGVGLTYNYLPRAYLDIYNAFRQGDLVTATAMQHRISDVVASLYRIAGNLGVMKYIVGLLGFPCGPARKPYHCLDANQQDAVRGIFEANRDLFGA